VVLAAAAAAGPAPAAPDPRDAAAVLGRVTGSPVADLPPPAVVVTINPEGRVKVARGPAELVLTRGRPGYFVVRVDNQSGGRPRLRPLGAYTGAAVNPFAVELVRDDRLGPDLSGRPVEFLLLKVACADGGRRELTLGFDAGQGTQDLGFRGEVPLLFDVRPAP
jgi:hypothetical protein